MELRQDDGQDFLLVRKPKLYLGGYFGARADDFDLRRGRTTIRFRWSTATPATPAAGTVRYLGERRFHALRVPHQGTFDLTISF